MIKTALLNLEVAAKRLNYLLLGAEYLAYPCLCQFALLVQKLAVRHRDVVRVRDCPLEFEVEHKRLDGGEVDLVTQLEEDLAIEGRH